MSPQDPKPCAGSIDQDPVKRSCSKVCGSRAAPPEKACLNTHPGSLSTSPQLFERCFTDVGGQDRPLVSGGNRERLSPRASAQIQSPPLSGHKLGEKKTPFVLDLKPPVSKRPHPHQIVSTFDVERLLTPLSGAGRDPLGEEPLRKLFRACFL